MVSVASLSAILNARLRDDVADVSVFAATRCSELGVADSDPCRHQSSGRLTLREIGLLGRLPAAPCGIQGSMVRILGASVSTIDWRAIFGGDHDEVERIAIWCRAYARTDATAFVNALDTFNDWLLLKVHNHDGALGAYQFGNVGGILLSARLRVSYPLFYALVKGIHERRLESKRQRNPC